MMERKNNQFGRTLESLLLTSGVKNYTIARALNYDVSYISKWISAAALPSRKNIDRIISKTALIIAEQGDQAALSELSRQLGIPGAEEDKETLARSIRERLTEAYFAASGYSHDEKYINNAHFMALPEGQQPFLMEFSKGIDLNQQVNIAVMADLFALDRTSKLALAGIEHHRFRLKEIKDNIHLHLILNLDDLKGNMVYDVVLLVHLLTHYSLMDFHLSYSKSAQGKLIFAVEGDYAGMTVLSGGRQYLCTTATRDLVSVNRLYNGILLEQDPDKMVFFTTAMDDMLESHEYIRALLASKNQWLVGHLTELLLAPEIFHKLSAEFWGADTQIQKEAEHAYALSVNQEAQRRVELMLYDTALTNFLLSGEVDFFNYRAVLSPKERKQELAYLYGLLKDNAELNVKVITGGFSDDFKYITNPCMFLSETMDYLRLENGYYTGNLLLVKDQSVQRIFHDFFEEIWNHREDVVLSEREKILEKLEGLINTADLLAGVE